MILKEEKDKSILENISQLLRWSCIHFIFKSLHHGHLLNTLFISNCHPTGLDASFFFIEGFF